MNLDLMLTQLARTVLIAALTWFAFGPASATPAANQADLEKLQEQVRALDKDNAVLAAKIDAQNSRIADLGLAAAQQSNHIAVASNQTSVVGNLISWTGVAISILVAVAGLITYFSATARAKAEANEAAQKWFDDKADSLTKQIADLEAQVQRALKAIDGHENRVAETAAMANAHIKSDEDAVAAMAATLFKFQDGAASNPVNQDAVRQVSQLSENLEAKPEKDFTSADHFTRGLALLQDKNFLGALQQFEKAAKDTKLSAAETVNYLFAQAFTLSRLDRTKEAIAVYDTLVQRYGEDSSPGVREQLAMALFNKGVQVGKLHGPEQEIAAYDTLVQRYGEDSSPVMRELVAMALFNKGVQLHDPEQEIAVYDALVRCYGDDSSPGVREQVTKAKNGAAFNAMLIAKEHWTDEVLRAQRLRQALTLLEAVVAQSAQDAVFLGNLGYCFFLLGEDDLARQWTAKCLQIGGAAQLEAQRGDARLHRVEPQDTAYEALLDELWGQVQASAAGA